MQVAIFIPCFVDQLYAQTAWNMIQILEDLGCEVLYNPNQTCCGQPAYNAGIIEPAKVVATKFYQDLEQYQLQNIPIVCPSASCVGFVRNHLANVVESMTTKLPIYELSEFLVQLPTIRQLQPTFDAKVMYHDACAALRECSIKAEPRQLLQQVQKLEVVYPTNENCCGFGGTFAVKYEPISVAMAAKKVQQALDLEATAIVSTDLSCLMHLQAYIDQQQLPLKTYHLADILVMD